MSRLTLPTHRPLRICIGPKEIGGQIPDYAAGFRALGHEVTTVINEPHALFADLAYDIDLRTAEGRAQLPSLIDRTDVFLFQYGTSLLPGNTDLPVLHDAGKAIIAICNGDDIRHISAYEQAFGVPASVLGDQYLNDPLVRPAQTLRNFERYASLMVSVPNQSGLALRPYMHFAYVMDLALYREHRPDREMPVVVHAPSSRAVKGTAQILAALDRLAGRGVRFELRLLEHLPNAQVREALTDADIAIDQLHVTYGKFAAEALATGCATGVVTFPELEPFARLNPVHALRASTLDADLEQLLTDRPYRRALAAAGRAHVARYHDRTEVCRRLLASLSALSAGTLRYDYYPDFFTARYALPPRVEFTRAQRQLATEVVAAWGVAEGTDLTQLARRGLIDPLPLSGAPAVPTWRPDEGLCGAGSDPVALAARYEAFQREGMTTSSPATPSPAVAWPNRDPSLEYFWQQVALARPGVRHPALEAELDPSLRLGLPIAALQTVMPRAAESPATLRATALLLLGTGQWSDARDLLAVAQEQDPTGVLTYYHGVAQALTGQLPEAVASMRQAITRLARRPRLQLFGAIPIISNRYWVEALRQDGQDARSLMVEYYARINRRSDFDHYVTDLVPTWTAASCVGVLAPYHAFLFLVLCGRALHTSFEGGPLCWTPLAPVEPELLKAAGVRTVVISYGGDSAIYGAMRDPSHRHAMLASYPDAGRKEPVIRARVDRWQMVADCIVSTAHSLDGHARWDVLSTSPFVIDVDAWTPAEQVNLHDGRTGPVRVLHTPNHRGYKGTEFLVEAVRILRAEGLQIELDLLEGVQNSEVRTRMQAADILAEQFIFPLYALSGIEGMATGIAVMANTGDEGSRIFRRFSFLDECPIVATTIEEIVPNLRRLVTDPALRHAVGRAGRDYVRKYHDYRAARELFGTIHAHLDGQTDGPRLIDMYHPLLGVRRHEPRIAHPLVGGRLSAE